MQLAMLSYTEVFISLLLAVLLGAVLGIERNLAGKMAGMRTYALVSLGSALFTFVSRVMVIEYANAGFTGIAPLNMVAQIITGIGFIGAGLVVLRGSQLTGITTAAGVWVSAGVGMACGFGLYTLALFTTGLTLFIFTILWTIEKDYIKKMLVKNVCEPEKTEEQEENGDE